MIPAGTAPVFGAINQMGLRTTEAELQARRTRTAAILSTVATGVIGVDAGGEVMHVNPRATELLGRTISLGLPLAGQLPMRLGAGHRGDRPAARARHAYAGES